MTKDKKDLTWFDVYGVDREEFYAKLLKIAKDPHMKELIISKRAARWLEKHLKKQLTENELKVLNLFGYSYACQLHWVDQLMEKQEQALKAATAEADKAREQQIQTKTEGMYY